MQLPKLRIAGRLILCFKRADKVVSVMVDRLSKGTSGKDCPKKPTNLDKIHFIT